uniref:C2H2-type domain-containing protein n=1 Tax=Erythrolobus australicus TaxID=1077150 RepID=A0A7S1TLN0_9RHOD
MESVAALMRVPAAREWLLDTSSSREAREDPESFRFAFSDVRAVSGDELLASILVGDHTNALTLKGYEAGLALLWSAPESCPAARLAALHSASSTADGRPLRIVSSRSVGHFGRAEYAIVVIFAWLEDRSLVVTFNKVTFTTRFSQSYRFEWQPGDVLRPTRLCTTIRAEANRVLRANDIRTAQLLKEQQEESKAGGLAKLVREQFWRRWVALVKLTWEGHWCVDYSFNERQLRRTETVRMTHDDDLLDNIDLIANGIFDDLVANISCDINLDRPFLDSARENGDSMTQTASVIEPAEVSLAANLHPGADESAKRDLFGKSAFIDPDGGSAAPTIPLEDLAHLKAYPNRGDFTGESGEKTTSPSSRSGRSNTSGGTALSGEAAASSASAGRSRGGDAKRRYLCVFCERMYTNKANLDRHVHMVHENQAPYECKLCATRFSVKCNLTRHVMNVHNHNRPFKCPLSECEWSFAQKYDLRRHLKRKHNIVGDPAEQIVELVRAGIQSGSPADTAASNM